MNIFKNRPLALFCALFIFSSILIYSLGAALRLTGVLILFALLFSVLIVAILRKKLSPKVIFAALCIFSIGLSFLSQWLIIDQKRADSLKYTGEHTLKMLITDVEYSSPYSSEYIVKIVGIDGKTANIKAGALCAFDAELDMGDTVYVRASIFPSDKEIFGKVRQSEDNIYINAAIYDDDDLVLFSRGTLTPRIVFNKIRDAVANYFDTALGEASPMARGFLLGDKDGLRTEEIRDFRRAGVSHLLAVSGLHISVIMGFFELVSKNLGIKKSIRSVILSVLSLVFLMLTGFSMSASRSVIMILFVYLSYLFIKECDSLTSLLCSVALIMLISPHSVMDVGLWLSFLATLGIITVYSPLSALWHKRRGDDLKGRILAILEKLAFALLLTFICNTFICLVVWQVFGEISTVSLIANPIISPLSEVFTLLVPIFVVLCSIPPLRYPLFFVLARFSEVISSLCAIFSSIKGAVISLEYDFAGIIIIIMSVALLVMLIIKLKRKWTVIIPPLAAALAFALCFTAHSLYNSGRISLSYFSEDKNDFLLLSSEGSSAICDISRGSYSASSNISSLMKEGYSTEISEYLITHYHSYHVSTTEKLMRREMLRRIYLPRPDTEKEKEIFRYISISAKAHGTELVLYEYGETIHLLNSSAIVLSNDIEGTSEPAIALLIKNGDELFSYFSDGYEDRAIMRQAAEQSKYIVFGAHTSSHKTLSLSPSEETEFVFYANEDISERYRVKRGDFGVYMPKDDKSAAKLRVFLGD